MSTILPNMNLIASTIGTDSGLQWEQNLNADLTLLDNHDHSPGKGAPIASSSLNINADLPMNGNNLTLLRSTRFVNQPSPLAGAADLGCLYISGGDLYYNNSGGDQVQITLGSSLHASSSGISSGNATAAFAAGVLVVNADVTTPANVQGASFLFGNNSAGSHFLTLQPPNAMAADFTLTLPNIPASNLFVTLDTSGNFATASNIQGTQIAALSLTGSQLANSTITGGKLAANTVTGDKIALLTIGDGNIASHTITANSIAPGTITGTEIATNANFNGKSTEVAGRKIVVANSNDTNGLGVIAMGFGSTGTVSFGVGALAVANGGGEYTISYNSAFATAAAVAIVGTDGYSQINIASASSTGIQFIFADSNDRGFTFMAIAQRA